MRLSFNILMLFVSISLGGYSQPIDNRDFGSAEERISFNKENNLDMYAGVLVEYEYRLVTIPQKTRTDWLRICESHFDNLRGVEVYSVTGINYFSVLTEGSKKNHEVSHYLPGTLKYGIEYIRRIYHLEKVNASW